MNIKDTILRFIYKNPVDYAKHIGVKVGGDCRFSGYPDFGSEPYLVEIGNHVMLAEEILFLTHDSANWVFRDQEKYKKTMKFGKIKICDNVYVGARVIILPGVTIGENSIIGAGSIVTHSVASNSVVVGVPGKVIKSVDQYADKLLDEMPEYDAEMFKQDRKRAILSFIDLYIGKNREL